MKPAVVVALLACMTRVAVAHPAPHALLLLDVHTHDVGVELHLPVAELDAALHGAVDATTIRAMVQRDLHAVSLDGTAWGVTVGAIGRDTDEQGPMVTVEAVLSTPPDHSARVFRLVNDVIGKEVPNHTTWVGIRSDFAHGQLSGSPVLVGTTHYLHHEIVIDRRGGTTTGGVRAMLRLGMQHIAEGTDHLLFLLVLLLPAPLLLVNRRWAGPASLRVSLGNVLRVVTAFTIGHSLTLLVGTLGWVRLPSAFVETLIAISILVSAVHAIRPLFPGREWLVAGAFGLVHGLAFATALSELRLDRMQLALALLSFNVGIELVQLVIVAVTLPWLLLGARSRAYPFIRIVGASGAALAALGWVAQRALHLPNPAEALVARPLFVLIALAATSLVLFYAAPKERTSS